MIDFLIDWFFKVVATGLAILIGVGSIVVVVYVLPIPQPWSWLVWFVLFMGFTTWVERR